MIKSLPFKYLLFSFLGLSVLNSNAQTVTATVSTMAGSGTSASTDGTGTSASFQQPTGITVDGSGNVYVSEEISNKIRKITPQGVVTTFAGSGTGGSADGTGTAASFRSPQGLAVDASGNIYVADGGNYKIRKITPAGVVTTLAGSGTQGNTDGTGTAAKFKYPTGVAVDASGNVYVADMNDHKIRKITPEGVVTTFAGSGSIGSADGDGTSATFNSPFGVGVDASGNVYVADMNNNKIRKITPAGVVSTLAGSGTAGSTDGTGTTASFSSPHAVALDGSGNAYVADYINFRIRKITPEGVVTTLAGNSSSTSVDGVGTQAGFNHPGSIAIDGSGNLYVSEYWGHKIRKITITTTTGVFSGQEYNILSLYPNPTQNELHIDVEGTKTIRIVDAMGRVVMEQEINTNMLSVAHLPKGIYAVVVEQQGKKYVSRLAKE